MTHIGFIAAHALEAGTSYVPSMFKSGTDDIVNEPDENDPRNRKTYSGFAPHVAQVLRQRWVSFYAQSRKRNTLKEPPIKLRANAESYGAVATEYYFSKKCSNFRPDQVIARESKEKVD
ncbi:hypothetical protein GYMLUDRAFT_44614 [Collybiopsis luxurians FD-317 M1]|uniref:Uncharacterized protein n=1 Tax=Collybiopsis luxurians FD-317 M1 TaxID=944289 RepID=A0A0D0C9R4_9AGAR|nr:hypothetical protein GYMLUDRAFT_44614 [Collybiopsis luxurians FD-317 M1]